MKTKENGRWLMLALATIQTAFSAWCQTNYPITISGGAVELAQQPDGKMILGGFFSRVAGQSFQNIVRVNTDGSLDTEFHPKGIGSVSSLAAQADGKILVGGRLTNFLGQPCVFARLNPDGYPDGTFVPASTPFGINAIAVLPDGKILFGGPLVPLARLNADGTPDATFGPTTASSPESIAIQADGKIIVNGTFTNLNGQERSGLARLNPDGTLDASFKFMDGFVWTMVLQGDGKILVSFYSAVPALTNTLTARLNADGTLDMTFNSALRTTVDSFAVQTDGKILAVARDSGLHRLNQDGSIDDSFTSRTNLSGFSLGLRADGEILVAGNFFTCGLTNTEVATQSLTYQDTTITWLRGGTSPEVWWTLFEYSTNGVDWISLGSGVPVPGGWQVSGVVLPQVYTLRARGPVSGGFFNESFWFAESYIGSPVLAVPPASRTNYVGTSASLAVSAQGSEPVAYQWFKNRVAVAGATNSILQLPNVQETDAGNYSVMVSNQFGALTSSAASLTVILPPQILVNNGNAGHTNGQFWCNIAGRAGDTIVVEFCGNFVSWVPLQTNVLGSGLTSFVDPRGKKNYPIGFYRARVLQYW